MITKLEMETIENLNQVTFPKYSNRILVSYLQVPKLELMKMKEERGQNAPQTWTQIQWTVKAVQCCYLVLLVLQKT